jgi:hypothetical protein
LIALFGSMVCIQLALLTSTGVDSMLAPQLMTRDLPVIIEVMDLDPQQSTILDDLLSEYLKQIDSERTGVSNELQSLDMAKLHEQWESPSWPGRRNAWREVRGEASSIKDDAAAAAWLETQRDWARTELEGILSAQEAPAPSLRTQLLDRWRQRQAALKSILVRDVQLVLDEKRGDRWNLVESAIARQRTPFGQVFPGESLNLGKLSRNELGRQYPLSQFMNTMISDYDQAWAEAVAARDEELAIVWPLKLDAKERRDWIEQLRIARRESAARQAVVNINLEWYEKFTAVMPDEHVIDFQRSVNQSMHPDIFTSPLADRVVARMLENSDVDAGTRVALAESRFQFGGPRLAIAANEREASRSAAPRRMVARAEQLAMADVFGPTALFQLVQSTAADPLARVSRLANRRRGIETAWLKRVRDIIGPDSWAAIPKNVKLPPAAFRTELVDEHGEPLPLKLLP